MQTHQYDVVIVGAGGAGMRAALESSTRVRTAVLTKLYPTRSHTGAAQGGMCAALANVEEDNWEWHTFDTVKGGDYLVDQDAAEVMCKEAIDAVLDLEKMGLPFNRTPEGRIDQRRFGGHTRNHGEAAVRRSCYAADRTGHMILQTLYQNCVKQGIEFYNEFYVLDLCLTDTDEGQVCTGVVAYELSTGELHVFHAKSVIFGDISRYFVREVAGVRKEQSNDFAFSSDLVTFKRRPALVVQADNLNTGLPQTIIAMITSNPARSSHPSRVFIPLNSSAAKTAGLRTDKLGGYKESGFGREGGLQGLAAYCGLD